jgi:hypothetical protein
MPLPRNTGYDVAQIQYQCTQELKVLADCSTQSSVWWQLLMSADNVFAKSGSFVKHENLRWQLISHLYPGVLFAWAKLQHSCCYLHRSCIEVRRMTSCMQLRYKKRGRDVFWVFGQVTLIMSSLWQSWICNYCLYTQMCIQRVSHYHRSG